VNEYNIYEDIAKRTNGDIYIGVVGPVRTGKSTFIKKFMELVVLPCMENEDEKKRGVCIFSSAFAAPTDHVTRSLLPLTKKLLPISRKEFFC
jgi:hypothetical protein